MKKLEFNPDNKKYYSDDFIKGFECGVERQFNADKKEITDIVVFECGVWSGLAKEILKQLKIL